MPVTPTYTGVYFQEKPSGIHTIVVGETLRMSGNIFPSLSRITGIYA